MRVTLRAGAELDTLTSEELARELERFAPLLGSDLDERAAKRGERFVRGPGDDVKTDANGAATLTPYRVPQGCTFTLHHVVVTQEGATASAPYKVTPVAIEVRRDDAAGELIDFAPEPDQAGQLPTILKRIGYPFRNGELVVVNVIAAQANTRVAANVTGTLRRGE